MKILFVEDDDAIAMGLQYTLEQEGYQVTWCRTVKEALTALSGSVFDLCLLDVMLPDGNGYEVCRKARERADTAVLFLTACDDEGNVVMGLDMGADDYITKPFRIRELLSRMKSVLRRYQKEESLQSVMHFKDVTIRTGQAKVFKGDREVLLTTVEYRLLLTLAGAKGRVLSRDQLLEGIWDIGGDYVNDNTLTVYIKRLREKLEDDPAQPALIKTVRGLGYQMEV
ncbi:MAG: response regulator transcription factor [Lachnospiraceae bacterium]|nr:response regulator transcription factor [Lachnospiraceae bacterium]